MKQENVSGVLSSLNLLSLPIYIHSSAGMLPHDLTGRTGTHRGLAEKESWN